MGFATFKGGIHTYDGKELTKNKPTVELLPKGELVFSMSQHIGAPAKAIVAKGDYVLMGQIIGEATGNVSSNIISSVSGTVKAVEPRLTVSGKKVMSVIIENDHEYKGIDGLGEKRDYKKLSKQEIRNIIKEAGIVGLGGAAFPTHVKLTPPDDEKIEYVIVNAAECEPYLTSDYRMMLEEPTNLIEGLKIELSLFPNAKGVIAVEDNKPEAIEKLKELTKNESNIEVKVCKTKYPQGGERTLIYAVTGRKIWSRKFPYEVGCIVSNVDTVISIYKAVAESTPLMRRIVTVTGDAIHNPSNFSVKIGTDLREIVDAAGGFKTEPEKIIAGGPLMGQAIFTLEVNVAKNTSGILAFTKDDVAKSVTTSCIRCGRCAEACPSRVIPQKMFIASENNDREAFESLHGMECCECGCCAYVCPARINLVQSFKQMKKSVIDNRNK